MFKTQIIRRSFSLFNRGVSHSQLIRNATRDGHETIRVQRVRFRKPFFNRSRLIGTAFGAGGAYLFLRWLDETPEEEAERKREDELSQLKQAKKDAARARGEVVDEEEEEEEDEEEALLFLPTGFSRPKPRRFYKGSDPEWQEFVRIAPDRVRIERIRGELVALVRDIAMKNPMFAHRLGKINPTAGTSWIEFKFPDGPPLEYERPGIELTEDGTIRRSTRLVNEVAHHRLTSILMPTAVAKSLYADAQKRVGRGWTNFKAYMGYEDKSKTDLSKLLVQFPPSHFPPNPHTPNSTTASTTPVSSPAPSPTDGAHQPPEKEPTPSTPGDPEAYERFGLVLPKPTALTLDLSTFRQAFRKEHKHAVMKIQPPRGTFMVSGLIEIIGERARMTLDVAAAYDPKLGKYVMLRAHLRSITQYRQDPKGGP